MLRQLAGLCLASVLLSVAAAGSPVAERQISGPRIELGELVPDAPQVMLGIDIGPAPPAGSTRLISRDAILRQVRAAGFDPSALAVPVSLRARRAGTRYTEAELAELLTTHVSAALPAGVTLIELVVSTPLTLDADFAPGPIRLPKLPKRAGVVKIAFSVELVEGGVAAKHLPVTAVVSQSLEAVASTVTRGARVQLTIQRGAVRISADATALSDGDLGEELRFRVVRTGKVLLARLVSPTSAVVRELR